MADLYQLWPKVKVQFSSSTIEYVHQMPLALLEGRKESVLSLCDFRKITNFLHCAHF